MTNSRVSKSALLRATAMAGGALVSLVHTSAHAATVGPITVTNAIDTGSFCGVTGTATVTGTTDDGAGNDIVITGIEFPNGTLNRNYVIRGQFVGQTGNIPVNGSFNATGNTARSDRVLVVREGDLQTNNNGQGRGSILSSTPIPRSILIAAGGECRDGAPNEAPVTNAGPDASVVNGSSVTLDGSGTIDGDGDALTFLWTQTAGPAVNLLNANSQTTGFTAPTFSQSTILEFTLRATDILGEFSEDIVRITVGPPNTPPTVDAGPDQSVAGGTTVTLAGSASDLDNDPLTTTWVQTGGATVTLSDPNALNPTFTAPPRGASSQTLTFELRADDGTVISSDEVNIIVQGNQAPTANITGPATAVGGSTFTLDGSGSTDPENDQLIYIWNQIGGPAATLAGANTPILTVTAPTQTNSAQNMQFELIVVDTFDAGDGTTFTVTIPANQSPVADAGPDQDVQGNSTVTLDGSGSTDPDGDTLTYSWTQLSGAPVTLSDPNAVQPTFTAPPGTGQDQVFEFQLTVSDSSNVASNARFAGGGTSSDIVAITVLANRPPVADAGADQGPIDAGQTVTLDASGSTDPDGDTLTYSWVQTSGTPVTLSDPSSAQPTFTAPNANETLSFTVTVSDGQASDSASVQVEVRAIGSITIIQQIAGSDTQVAFSSNLSALTTSLTTVSGTAQVTAQSVPIGNYTVTAADLSAQGLAVTSITCSDSDSTGDVSSRTATIDLSAGEDVTCTFIATNSREAAQVAIFNYLTGRNALILANQPDLQRRIDRLSPNASARSGSVNAYGVPVPGAQHLPIEARFMPGQARISTDLGMAIGGGSDRFFDLWAEAYFSRATIGTQKTDFGIVHIGADLKLSDSVLVGAIVQFDDLSDRGELEVGEAEGDGFMAGPYITARLAPQLYVEARAAWGSSDNIVSPLAGQRDAFETSRSLYSGSIVGQIELGQRTILRPELTLRYLSEDQKAYTDSLGIAIPSQTVDQGDISFRPRLSHVIETESGLALRPFAEVEGIYTFGTEPDASLANLVAGTFADTFGNFRGRIEGGLDLMGSGSFRATISGFYDGIGADGFSNEGIHLGVSFGF